jgi:hypothetical protein
VLRVVSNHASSNAVDTEQAYEAKWLAKKVARTLEVTTSSSPSGDTGIMDPTIMPVATTTQIDVGIDEDTASDDSFMDPTIMSVVTESDDSSSNEEDAEIQLEKPEDDSSDKLRKAIYAMLVATLAALVATLLQAESQRSLQ